MPVATCATLHAQSTAISVVLSLSAAGLVLLTVAVQRDAQRGGIARMLLQELELQVRAANASRIVTDVATGNTPAMQLFLKRGYRDASANKSASSSSTTQGKSQQPGGFGAGTKSKTGKKQKKGSTQSMPAPQSIELVLHLSDGVSAAAGTLSQAGGQQPGVIAGYSVGLKHGGASMPGAISLHTHLGTSRMPCPRRAVPARGGLRGAGVGLSSICRLVCI
jgi:hypothetical protein